MQFMQKTSLDAIAREHLGRARSAEAGRSAVTAYGGHEHALRQTVPALTADTVLGEHESPGEASIGRPEHLAVTSRDARLGYYRSRVAEGHSRTTVRASGPAGSADDDQQ